MSIIIIGYLGISVLLNVFPRYTKAIRLIQREFNLLPLTKATYQVYKTYGRQVTTGTQKDDARFVAQFMDIFENSFN